MQMQSFVQLSSVQCILIEYLLYSLIVNNLRTHFLGTMLCIHYLKSHMEVEEWMQVIELGRGGDDALEIIF